MGVRENLTPQGNRDDERKHKLIKIKKRTGKRKKRGGGKKKIPKDQYPAFLMAIQFHTEAKQNKLWMCQLTLGTHFFFQPSWNQKLIYSGCRMIFCTSQGFILLTPLLSLCLTYCYLSYQSLSNFSTSFYREAYSGEHTSIGIALLWTLKWIFKRSCRRAQYFTIHLLKSTCVSCLKKKEKQGNLPQQNSAK